MDYYAYAWLHEDYIVNAFIAQSGTSMMTGPFAPKDKQTRAKEGWFNMTQTLGCGGAEKGSSTLACAQKATLEQIQAAMPQASGFESIVGFFGPTYDDEVVFENIYELGKEGEFVRQVISNFRHTIQTLIPMAATLDRQQPKRIFHILPDPSGTSARLACRCCTTERVPLRYCCSRKG